MKKCAVLFSGGKDSCLALHKVFGDKEFDVRYLLSVIPENPDSYMFHKPNLELLEKQAEMLGVDLVVAGSKGEKEEELKDLEELINAVSSEVDVIVVGGIASSYQGNRVERICKEAGVEFYAPLWNYDAEQVWKELLENKFEVIITKISAEGISHDLLGKKITRELFDELKKKSEKFGFRVDFEGGEAETAVLWMPGFTSEIGLEFDIRKQSSYNAILDIKSAKEFK